MKPADVHLWEAFVRGNPGYFETVEYDFAVGPPPEWLDVEHDPKAAAELPLYQKKIDVLGFRANDIFIVEVKPDAGSNAIGQVMSYKILFGNDHPNEPAPRLMVITNKLQNGYLPVYQSHGVLVAEVGYCPKCAPLT